MTHREAHMSQGNGLRAKAEVAIVAALFFDLVSV
jgi:hypothetical protein